MIWRGCFRVSVLCDAKIKAPSDEGLCFGGLYNLRPRERMQASAKRMFVSGDLSVASQCI